MLPSIKLNAKMSSTLTNNVKIGFALTGILVSTAGLLFNIFGIYALIKTKSPGNKQTYLLINISVVSLCMCLLFVPSWVLSGLLYIANSKVVEEYLFIAQTGKYMTLVACTMVLSIDRFLAVALPFKHRAIVTSKFVWISISACWFIGMATRIPFLVIKSPNILLEMVYFDISVNAINLLFQPVTYVYILVKWRQRQTQINNANILSSSPLSTRTVSFRARDSKREASMLKIALMIAGSCILSGICDIIYAALGMSTPSSNATLMSPIGLLIWTVIPTIQSLFYILTKPEIKKLFMRKLFHNVSHDE